MGDFEGRSDTAAIFVAHIHCHLSTAHHSDGELLLNLTHLSSTLSCE